MVSKEVLLEDQADSSESGKIDPEENPPGEEDPPDVLARIRKERGFPPIHHSVPGLRKMGERRIPLQTDEIETK